MRFSGGEVMDWGDDEHCDHEDYDRDILTGTAHCWSCGHKWVQTAAEIEREREAQIAYDKLCDQWEREQHSLRTKARNWAYRLRRWWNKPAAPADEIPF